MFSGTILHFTESPNDFIILMFYQRYCRLLFALEGTRSDAQFTGFADIFLLLLSQCTRHLCHGTANVATCQFSFISIDMCPLSISVKAAQALFFCLQMKESG